MSENGVGGYFTYEAFEGTQPPEPTSDQCSQRARMEWGNGEVGYACWYPQMGGYTSHAVVVPQGGCFDVWVWHDGAFPFSGEPDDERPLQSPVNLHHCAPEQFVRFGQWVATLPGME